MRKVWYWVIGIVAVLFLIGLFSPEDKTINQISLTGKVIDKGVQSSSEQIEIEEQTQQQNQEEKCDWGYSGKRKCDGKVIEKEWISSDCSSKWFYYLKCYYDCEDGECKDKPIPEPDEEKCDYGYSDEYKCDGKILRRKWISSDCSFDWFYFSTCDYRCENGVCIKDAQEQLDYLKVTYIVDGDTLDVDTGDRVRLICIDTPERGEYYYSEAKDYLKTLTLNKEIILEKDISETDRYGRLLRYIYLKDGSFVNELLVENGYAKAYPYSPDTTLCPQIQQAESRAKSNNLGIWAEQEEQEPEQTENIICSYDAYNCGDFSSCSEVMEVFNFCSSDIHRLDGDNDRIPCESLC